MYEFSDHLGNVRVVLSDKKTRTAQTGAFSPEILNYSDYYPFGMERKKEGTWAGTSYRYGYNGMEKDDEVATTAVTGITGNTYTTDFRELDTRIGGRWWSPDPIVKPWESPYAGFADNPIAFADPSGLDPEDPQQTGGNSPSTGSPSTGSPTQEQAKTSESMPGSSTSESTNKAAKKKNNSQAQNKPNQKQKKSPIHMCQETVIVASRVIDSPPEFSVSPFIHAVLSIFPADLKYKINTSSDFVNGRANPHLAKVEDNSVQVVGDVAATVTGAGAAYRSVRGGIGLLALARLEARLAAEDGLYFYRAVSNAEYAALEANNGLTFLEKTQLFVSTRANYSRNYLLDPRYDKLIEFEMKPGTMDYFREVGVFHRTPAGASGWAERGNLLWKFEKGTWNLGIQQNTSLFNKQVIDYRIIK